MRHAGARRPRATTSPRPRGPLRAQQHPHHRRPPNHPFDAYEPDAAWPDLKLAVELDGRAAHSTPRAFERDRRKQNALVLEGWTVLRFTYNQIMNHAGRVAAELTQAYDHPLRRNHTHNTTHDTIMLPSPNTKNRVGPFKHVAAM